ncbi:MAG TPA: HAD family hydrolase [Steroidobacteraceae bacterium]|nr:HAD family hydrolase [Steroidobacteraceae bacterium]
MKKTRGFVLDMDGTLVLGDRRNKGLKPLPGAIALLETMRKRGAGFVILTNGTTRTPLEYAATLREIGFPVTDEAVVTPASVAGDYFAERGLSRVLVLGGPGVSQPIADAGVSLVPVSPTAEADAVFVGWHRGFTMDDLDAACNAIWHGARLFAASLSPFFATADGRALGTSRAIAAAITSITGARASVLGKPSLHALRSSARRLKLKTSELAVVGDDPGLEVPMAHRGGALAVAVHTGIGSPDSYAKVPANAHPHLSVRDAAELLELYRD